MSVKLQVKFVLFLLFFILFSCNREDIWNYNLDNIVDPDPETVTIPDVKITSVTATGTGVDLQWDYPEGIDINGVDVTWTSGTDSDTVPQARTGLADSPAQTRTERLLNIPMQAMERIFPAAIQPEK